MCDAMQSRSSQYVACQVYWHYICKYNFNCMCTWRGGEGLIILNINYFFEILSLCWLISSTNNKRKTASDGHFDLWVFLIRKCCSIRFSAVLDFKTEQVKNICTYQERGSWISWTCSAFKIHCNTSLRRAWF